MLKEKLYKIKKERGKINIKRKLNDQVKTK